MKKALSNKDIFNLVKGRTKILSYKELKNYDDLNDVIGKYRSCVILYETKRNFGHWVCINETFDMNNNRIIEHFDSYGILPDEEILFVPEYFRKEAGVDFPHLTWLLYNSGYQISYNEYKLQKEMKDINTCGRWVISRILLKNMPLEIFVRYFINKKYEPDIIVTAFTNLL